MSSPSISFHCARIWIYQQRYSYILNKTSFAATISKHTSKNDHNKE